ncbi:hypothetical protein KIL84_010129 [Mauremys mutica]|uniref:R-spondin Fu-CRD domain-containing protein n=1 Tax=Mauremys mutica TaxID=74926 RepID=A0A9D3XNL3_9SAUR|nr:hypothetical protein KIL84_010129 [Mauremys mutica]
MHAAQQKPSAGLFENCTGCVMCSEDNGCIACQQRLFLLIWRDGIRQYGACVHACPPGYFGLRGQEVNRCTKCRSPSCESCFSKDFCMKCKEKFYLHKGKCFSTCPPNTTAQASTRECQGNFPFQTNSFHRSELRSKSRFRSVPGSQPTSDPFCVSEKPETIKKTKREKKQKKQKADSLACT